MTVARLRGGCGRAQPLAKNVQVAHASQFARKPFQLLLEMFAPLAIDQVGNRPQLAAQAAGRGAQVMDPLRLTPARLGSAACMRAIAPLSAERISSAAGYFGLIAGIARVTGPGARTGV